MTVTLDMDVNDFVATTFTSTVAKVAVVGKECINILSVIAGSTICTFIFEGVLNEASIVDKFVEQVKQSGLKDFKVLDVSVKPPGVSSAHCSPPGEGVSEMRVPYS